MRFDIHVHTHFSPCGELEPAHIIQQAGSLGLDGVCITDHDCMEIQHDLQEGIQANGLCVIFGLEYTTSAGDFLLFGPFEDLTPGLPAQQLLMLVREKGGIAVAAHPFRTDRPVQEHIIRQGLCTVVESCNGRNTELENLEIENWRRHYELTECGGSDAHTINELGSVLTSFFIPVFSREDLIRALKQGMCKPDIGFNGMPAGRSGNCA